MNQELLDQAWFLACDQEGYSNQEVPDWAVQRVTETQQRIYNEMEQE